MKMKIQKLAATLLNVTRLIAFAGLLTLMTGSALAGPTKTCADVVTSGWCDTELVALCTATDDAGSLKDRDENGLISKVVGASIKLVQGKIPDADQKLGDYEAKLDQLASTSNTPKAKISEEDADDLSDALIEAQLCVDALP